MFQSTRQFLRPMALLMGLIPFLHGTPARAAETDLSNSPLSSVSTADVKPNILFTLDDSGSMDWRYMPDALSTREHRVGFRNSSCNLVYYNPATRYVIPKTSTGLDVNAAAPTTYTAAYENGFGTYTGWETRTSSDSGSTWTAWTAAASCTEDQSGASRRQCRVLEVASAGPTLNLSSSFRAFVNVAIDPDSGNRRIDTAQPAYYWNYLGSTELIPVRGDCELEIAPVFNIRRATYSGGVATFEVDGLETRTSADSGTTWTQWAPVDPSTACTADTTNPTLRECRQRTHGLAVGNQVGISVDPAGYQGVFTVASVPTARTFTVALATNPGNYRRVSQLQRRTSTNTGVTWSAWANVSTCTEVSSGANQTECQVEGASAGYSATCTPSRTGSPGSYAWTGGGSAVDCRVNNGTGGGWSATSFATVKEICTDGSTTTTTCAAAAKTALWRKVVVSATSGPATADLNGDTLINASDADERTNFANWYSYYGNRLRMMKSASGRAFLGMTDSKRIGFITINPENPVIQSKFITIQDFDVTQKAAWFRTLYSQSSNGSTPLREALSRAGRYFAAKTDGINSGMSGDPVQYSCQQNFNILTTDGYWNGAGGVKLNGTTAMDNQDGIIEELDAYRSPGSKYQMSPRPIFDGASTTFNWNTARRYYRLNNTCIQQEKKTAQEQGRLGQWQQQTSQLQKTTGQVQYRTNLQIKTGPLEYQSRIQSKTGQLQFTTNLESRTGALEYQSKIQRKSGQVQYTTNLERQQGQLQYQSKIQTRTGQVEYRSNLERLRGPLEYQSKIQSKTGQLQYQSKIQSKTGQLQMRTLTSFFPIIWSSWNSAVSCTPSPLATECRIDPSASFVKAHSCTSTVSGPTWTGGASAVDCNNTGVLDGTWTAIATCTPSADVSCRINSTFVKAQSCSSTFDGTMWSGGASAVDCNNTGVLDGSWDEVGANSSCTSSADVSCRINDLTWTYRPYGGTCDTSVSGATITSDAVGRSNDCRTIAYDPVWHSISECDTTLANTQCRMNPGASVFTKVHSCTSTFDGTKWTGDNAAIECNNTGVLDGTWTNIATCTPSADVSCQINASWVYQPYGGTCTSTVGATWTGGATATACRTIAYNPTWTAIPSCNSTTPNAQCRIDGSFVKADSCTSTVSGTNWTGGASGVECNNTGAFDGAWTPIASCTPSSDVFCRINPAPAWTYVATYAPTCTSTVSGATWTSSGGNATECRAIAFNPAGWTDRATCDTATPNVQCRVNASFVKTDSCTTTLSGTNWTGGASAVECSTGAFDGAWTPIASCTPSSDIFCRVNGTFTDVTQAAPTCTSTVSGATWTSSGGIATDCSTAGGFTAWVNAPTCTESTNFQCRINAAPVGVQPTVPLDVTSAPCNAQTRSGSAGSYVYTGGAAANYCETVVIAPYVDVAYACTPDVNHDAAGRTVQCQLRDPTAWTNTPSCTMNATTDCRTVDASPWTAASNCVEVTTPDATGLTTQCRPTGVPGFKLEVQGETISQAYSGPNQTGTALGSATTNRETTWSDSVPGTCFAAAPAVPGVETVVGVGPPTPPPNCNSGTQIWPCETYTSGLAGGVTANIASASWTPPGDDPSTEPAFATFVTTAAHLFLAGHSVTIAGGTNALYRGDWQIVEVPDDSVPANTQFKVLMPSNPGATAHTGGTASLFAGSSNSLADVAQYYYKTDLRTTDLGNCTGALGMSVCDNNVPSTGAGIEDDRANWQHMTTFTMGLGLDGTLLYSPSYRSDICVAKSITGASWAANVATVTTSTPHGFAVNQAVTISGGDVAGYRGQTRVASVPTATTFTYALTPTPGVGVFGTGTATGCGDFVRLREGTINWPVPAAGGPTALDDLWHAAVNGRGQYFSAGNPDTVVSSLTDALAGINARVAAAAAAATSNLEPVAGDNFAYTAKYKTQAWTGDLEAKEIDLTTGSVRETVIWSAQAKLDDQTKTACDNRTIKLFRAGATNNLVDFKWDTYGCDAGGAPTGLPVTTLDAAEQANFSAAQVALLSQYPSYGTGVGVTVDQRTPAAGANLVNYLRGQRGKEGFSSAPPVTNTDVNKLYRTREHVLGAIINAQPVFVKGPFAEYDELAYSTFKVSQASRTPIVYASANDGMLHAILAGSSIVDPDGGKESWAFMPSMVLPNLYKLASENYASDHTYSVDGTPVVGDVYDPLALPSPTWKTILVSGMNKGGKGYFALDVTDPAAPKALWEFKHDAGNCVTVDATSKAPAAAEYSDCHIGYTYSNPIISKLKGGADDGRWVVFVTSGYNNINSPPAPGDGQGYLYVLEAMTGKLLYKIGTGAGTAADPSGLNHISAWSADPLRNNTTERIYGGDLLGNVWRFDVNDLLNAAGREAQLVANVQDEDGVGQPITTRPELAEVGGAPFVYVATGRYLGPSDLGTGQKNSVWALRDTLGATPMADPRGDLRKLIITTHGSGTSAFRTNGCTTQCDPTNGWFVDLPDPGERVNIDMKLQLGTLVVASNVPETNACNIGGYAWLNYFNNGSGEAIKNSADQAVGRRLVGAGGSESLAVGLNIVRLPSGKTVVIATTSAAQQLTVEAPFDVAPPTGKRVSWREIVQ